MGATDAYKAWKNNDNDHFEEYLEIILEELSACFVTNYPINDRHTGLYMVGSAGGNAKNVCDYDDILGDAFFFIYFMSDW